jgi:hypothetical protein
MAGFDAVTQNRGITIIRSGGGTRFTSYRPNATHIVVPSLEVLRSAVLAPVGLEMSELTCAIVNFDWLVDCHRNKRVGTSDGYMPPNTSTSSSAIPAPVTTTAVTPNDTGAAAVATGGGVDFGDFFRQTDLVPPKTSSVVPQKLQTRSISNSKSGNNKIIASTTTNGYVGATLAQAPSAAVTTVAPSIVTTTAGVSAPTVGGVFAGHTFTCYGMSLKDKLPLVKFIKAAGGVMLDAPHRTATAAVVAGGTSSSTGAAEYVVMHTRAEAALSIFPHSQFVNQLWVAMCLRENQLLPTIQSHPFRHELLLYAPQPEVGEVSIG